MAQALVSRFRLTRQAHQVAIGSVGSASWSGSGMGRTAAAALFILAAQAAALAVLVALLRDGKVRSQAR